MTPRRLDPALIQERLREIQLLLADLVEGARCGAAGRRGYDQRGATMTGTTMTTVAVGR
jgi:hypothetical protein